MEKPQRVERVFTDSLKFRRFEIDQGNRKGKPGFILRPGLRSEEVYAHCIYKEK